MAVSYTHLDVYKRQAFNRVNPTFSYACLFLAGMILVPLAVMNLKIGRYDYS